MSQAVKTETPKEPNGLAIKANGTAVNGKLEALKRPRHVSGGVEEIVDPFCNPEQPQRISFHDVTSAAFLIRGGVERTPCPVDITISQVSVHPIRKVTCRNPHHRIFMAWSCS